MGTGAYAYVGKAYVHWVEKGELTEAELVAKVRSELHNRDRMFSQQACKKQQQPQQPQAQAQAPPRQQQFRKRDREGAVASVEQQVEACFSYLERAFSYLERHAGMAYEVERASRGVLTAYGSLSLEQALQRMHASLGEPASATISCVKWSDDMARTQALGRARAQERAVRTAMQEVQRVQREMTHKMGEMRAVATQLNASAAALVQGVNVEDAEDHLARIRRAWNLQAYGEWGLNRD